MTNYICARCDQKITVILNFFYLSIIFSIYRTLICNTLMEAFFFSILKHFCKALLCIVHSFYFDYSFISSIVANRNDYALATMLSPNTHDSLPVITFLGKSGSSFNVVNIAWAMLFLLQILQFWNNFHCRTFHP